MLTSLKRRPSCAVFRWVEPTSASQISNLYSITLAAIGQIVKALQAITTTQKMCGHTQNNRQSAIFGSNPTANALSPRKATA